MLDRHCPTSKLKAVIQKGIHSASNSTASMLFSKAVAAGLAPAALVLAWDPVGISIGLSVGIPPGLGGPGDSWSTPSCPGGTTTITQTE